MECAGRAKRRRRFGCCEALAQLKAPSPLRSAGALQMVVLTRSACGRTAGQEGVVFLGDHVVESNQAATCVNAVQREDWTVYEMKVPLPRPSRVGGRAQGGGRGGAAWSCPRG